MEFQENRVIICSLTSPLKNAAKFFAAEAARVEAIYNSIPADPTSDECESWHAMDQQHVAFVMASIMCAYSHVEANINSAIQQSSIPDDVNKTGVEPNQAAAIRNELERASSRHKGAFADSSLLRKCNVFLHDFLNKAPIARTDSVYTDMEVLRELRHAIAHHSSEWETTIDGTTESSHKISDNQRLAQSLRARGITPLAFYESGSTVEFPRAFLTAYCADWCCKAAEAFIQKFFAVSAITTEDAQFSSSSELYIKPDKS